MKKWGAIILCAALLLSACTAFAYTESDLTGRAVANGGVTAAEYIDLTAPCSGVLEPFDASAGDVVMGGNALFSMLTAKVTAAEEATVTWVFADAGESADAAIARYGAIVSMEPEQSQRILASTAQAYSEEENKTIHVGEVLYFKSSRGGKDEGAGRVISVSGANYVVDILTGEFEAGETLTLYRDDDYSNKENVGKGSVVRRDPLSAAGSGVIAEMCVEAGQSVQPGDVLFTLMGADADVGASPIVSAPEDGVIAAVHVGPGQQVWKGQALARLFVQGRKEIVAEVDEVYLKNIKVGDELPVTLDTDETSILTGTVTEISALGNTIQNAAYYTVHITVSGAKELMLGQSAKVYLPR
ncbi:MAG: HlyD family efflux transporter periplasmic adaptor subunit [Clostridia bacterium]|nr:HlyD family efflux transporter periplasmic adaptor subunit [Clostridia bacterium]